MIFRLICSVLLFHLSHSKEWIVDDAIYITARSAEVETRSPSESSGNGSAEMEEKVQEDLRPGRCAKFRECYPIYFLTDQHDQQEPSVINAGLLDFILETSDVCEPQNVTNAKNTTNFYQSYDKADIYIWCPDRRKFPVIQRPAYTTFKAESEDEEGVFCGTVKTPAGVAREQPGKEERVVGGRELNPGEAPYAAVMTFRGKQVCGGSVIDQRHILTAAHCVSHLKASSLSDLRILVGDHDINDPMDVEHQERNVSKIIYHKDFSVETLHDDVAMIEISEPVHYASNVGSVCLSDGIPPYDDGTIFGTLVGWGNTGEKGVRPLTPKTANLRIWTPDDCEEVYDGIAPEEILEKAFCAGGFQDGGTTDACRGDSGGPLSIIRNDKVQQVGIVSFGIGCGQYPGVFTRVSEFQEWIDKHRSQFYEL